MTSHPMRRLVIGVLAAIAVVFGGSFTAAGLVGTSSDVPTASPTDGADGVDESTDPEGDEPTTDEGDGTSDETTDEGDEATEDDADEATEDDADEATEDDADEASEDSGEESGEDGAREPCTLTAPPHRAAAVADAAAHPGWARGKHYGWCVIAERDAADEATEEDSDDAEPEESTEGEESESVAPAPKSHPTKDAHPGKGHGKGHGKSQGHGKGHGKH